MIFTVSVQQDSEEIKCPEKITKSQMPPLSILLLVENLGHRFPMPLKITKSLMPSQAMVLLVKNWGIFFIIFEKKGKGNMASRAMLPEEHFSRTFIKEATRLFSRC